MPLFDEFADARALSPAAIGAIQLSKTIGTYVGTSPVLITRPADTRMMTLRCESGTIRLRPNRYTGFEFTAGDLDSGGDEFDVEAQESPRLHFFTTGDGPFQLTFREALLPAGTSIVIGTDNTFTRTVGTWWEDGFWPGKTFSVTGSASNNGTFTAAAGGITNSVITVDEDITVGEGAQTDLVMTGIGAALPTSMPVLTNYWVGVVSSIAIQIALSQANALAGTFVDIQTSGLGGGRYNFAGPAGWAPAAVATLNKTDGYGSIAVAAGDQISFAAPAELTIVGFSSSDACSYWFGR